MKSALSAWRVQPLVTTSLRCCARYCAGNRCGSRGLRANCNSGLANCLATALRLRVKSCQVVSSASQAGSAAAGYYTTRCLKTVLKRRFLRVSNVDSGQTPAEYFKVCKVRRGMHRMGCRRGEAGCARHAQQVAASVTLQWRKYCSGDFNFFTQLATRHVSEGSGIRMSSSEAAVFCGRIVAWVVLVRRGVDAHTPARRNRSNGRGRRNKGRRIRTALSLRLWCNRGRFGRGCGRGASRA
jgi:hypothetical protein